MGENGNESVSAAIAAEAGLLLQWYDAHRRTLPWRALPGVVPDPYHVWLAEIMLQQTTVAAVGDYFRRFVARWPLLEDLAEAELDQVLHAWQGLGYYARARNLHRCARALVAEHGGRFPDTEAALRTLPGIGQYTAAAIAAIAFERPAVVVDGNVERVVARLFAIIRPLPGAKPELARLAGLLSPALRPGDHAQAMMDLGATVCTPRAPSCGRCPWRAICLGRKAGIAQDLPRKAPKAARPIRHGIAFWAVRPDGAVLLRRRPERGLLGGMIEIPSTEWRGQAWPEGPAAAARHAPAPAEWRMLPGMVRHTFTHFHLELVVASARLGTDWPAIEGLWSPVERLGEHALPSVMKKIVRHALANTLALFEDGSTSSPRGSSRAAHRSGSGRRAR